MTIPKARTAAADAARQLLQDAKAAAVVQAQTALHDARAECRAKFAAALALGWAAEQLAETGNPAKVRHGVVGPPERFETQQDVALRC